MTALDIIRFIAAVVFIVAGMVFYTIQFIGVFRFKYVLNRMHATAIGDTLGGGLILIGTFILYGFTLAGLKVVLIELFLLLTAPVSSHMVAKLEVMSHRDPSECAPVKEASELTNYIKDIN